jgi:hypothetical protein
MSITIKHGATEKGFGPAVVNGQVKSYDTDPFVVKKVEKAMETLKKVGFPNNIKK